MSYPEWPAGLPLPQRRSYRVSGKSPVKRIKMEAGADRTFRVSRTIIRQAPFSVVLDEAQLFEFWRFYDTDANAGTDWVMLPLKVGNVVALHRCKILGCPVSRLVSPTAQEISFTVETDQQVLADPSL